ncbi:MAG: hypothetical protein ACHQIM_18755 [Sphingobacteriales bacterium]
MKNFKLFLFLMLAIALASCDPREDRKAMPAPVTALKFTVVQTPGYDNEVTMTSLTPGVIPFWDFGFGVSNKAKLVDTIPFAGTFVIKYYAYSQGGPVVDSSTVKVTNNDVNYFKSPMWNLLANGVTGKTWVWAPDNPNKCMTGGGGFTDVAPVWWKDALDQAAINDQMVFDLKGSFNFKLIATAGSKPGKFKLDVSHKQLTIIGSDISKGMNQTYDIITLNDNELVLAASHPASWGGWRNFFYFKKQGYVYP